MQPVPRVVLERRDRTVIVERLGDDGVRVTAGSGGAYFDSLESEMLVEGIGRLLGADALRAILVAARRALRELDENDPATPVCKNDDASGGTLTPSAPRKRVLAEERSGESQKEGGRR
jgi:hypothetical protein